MTNRWLFRNSHTATREMCGDKMLPPGLQIQPIRRASAPSNRRLALFISVLTLTMLSGSVYLSILGGKQGPAYLDHPKVIGLVLYEGGDGEPAGPSLTGGGRVQDQSKMQAVETSSTLNALTTLINPSEEPPESIVLRKDLPDKHWELLSLQPGLLPANVPGNGSGVGGGLGNESGNGQGSGLGRRRGSTWIHSAHGDEEIKVAVDFLDTRDYIPPEYPGKALFGRISGDVVLAVTIDTNGTPLKWSVVEGEPLLVEATLKVLPRWHFIPFVYKGEKVGASFEVRIRFALM